MTIDHLVFIRKMKLILLEITLSYFLYNHYISTELFMIEAKNMENWKQASRPECEKW